MINYLLTPLNLPKAKKAILILALLFACAQFFAAFHEAQHSQIKLDQDCVVCLATDNLHHSAQAFNFSFNFTALKHWLNFSLPSYYQVTSTPHQNIRAPPTF